MAEKWTSTEGLMYEAAEMLKTCCVEGTEVTHSMATGMARRLVKRADEFSSKSEEDARMGRDRDDIECPKCGFPSNTVDSDEVHGMEIADGWVIECRECGHEFEHRL